VLPKLKRPTRFSPQTKASLTELIDSVNTRGFKGLVTKKRASNYEPGLRFGAWQKMWVNLHHSGARPEMGRNFLPARMVSRHRIRSSSR
jgi:hypothetical protein